MTQNRLASEKSPYLLQHASNPVAWYPWCPEAFAKARAEDKPIFLSIGYSTCHWCHVMAHESFEDPDVAALMNDAFVSIKLDREERPDIDSIYMNVCQMMTGSGGWPLTIIMTPDKQPFFAGTYIPKYGRYGRAGMVDLIPQIKQLWQTRRHDVTNIAAQVVDALRQMAQASTVAEDAAGADLDEATLHAAYRQLDRRFDEWHGGFSDAPKFPTPHNLLFLLRYWKRTGEAHALDMVETTLQAMRRGGIYDHLGFGFHRYATDRVWLVPHFEKMLYDQAMLAMAYAEAFQATGKSAYRQTAREVVAYVLRDMTAPEGGFYSAEDADSEGEEGKFYLWTVDEVREALGDADADFVIDVFSLEPGGNFREEATQNRTGANILHLRKSLDERAHALQMAEHDLCARLDAARQRLFDRREGRIHPHKDDKILTDWNGLMIAALAKAARAFDEPVYAEAAARAAAFVLTTMRTPDGRLLHRYRDGHAGLPGLVDDYAFMIWGLLELYEATFDVHHLEHALDLNGDLTAHFWDAEGGGFFATPGDGEELLVRQKEVYDGAVPSGNSVAMLNLLRLGRITAHAEFEDMAAQIGRAFSETIQRAPSAFTLAMMALDFGLGPSYEVVIAGEPDAEDTRAMQRALNAPFLPNKVVLLRPASDATPAIAHIARFTAEQGSIDDRATAYVCRNYQCALPTTDVAKMLSLLGVR
ncbi:MAG: thioredoxin domain-containing protein [Anaerolineae bacterium]|nr:thioredoxin domain-containing protein [Anaerolineae bacterium]